MGAWLGVPASTEDENGPKSRKRTGAGKETAKSAKKQSSARSEVLGVSQMTGPDVPVTAPEQHVPQGGYEDDNRPRKKWVHPPRIKTSQLTTEERAKFQAILDKIFAQKHAEHGMRIVFNPHDVMEVMQKVIPYLQSEPMLIEDVPFDVTIVGDLHGQLYDLNRIFKDAAKDGKRGWECRKFVFLGNYIDAGRQPLEIVMALFCIKMLYPDDIFLLRGNHEFIEYQLEHEFFYDILERYDEEDAKVIFFQINETFCWLSVAAIVGGIYFCAHGGLPFYLTRHHMRLIRKPYMSADDDTRLRDIIRAQICTGLRETMYSNGSVYFGFDAVCRAMACMEVKSVFRGDTPVKEGCVGTWGVVHTVFSASDFERTSNKSAVAFLNAEGRLTIRVFHVDPNRRAWEAKLRKASGCYEEGDPRTICEPVAKVASTPGKTAKRSGKSAKRSGKSAKKSGKSAKRSGKSAKRSGKSAKRSGKSANTPR